MGMRLDRDQFGTIRILASAIPCQTCLTGSNAEQTIFSCQMISSGVQTFGSSSAIAARGIEEKPALSGDCTKTVPPWASIACSRARRPSQRAQDDADDLPPIRLGRRYEQRIHGGPRETYLRVAIQADRPGPHDHVSVAVTA
jgi:hypothetical protein